MIVPRIGNISDWALRRCGVSLAKNPRSLLPPWDWTYNGEQSCRVRVLRRGFFVQGFGDLPFGETSVNSIAQGGWVKRSLYADVVRVRGLGRLLYHRCFTAA